MAAEDLTRLRFGYSPLAEVIASLRVLHSGCVHPLHRRWAEEARHRLRALDTTVLRAIVPPGPAALTPPVDISTAASIQQQLRLVADWSPHQLRAELETVWCGRPMATAAREVIRDGPAGAHRVATALAAYWDTALAPHWDRMRAVLEADIAYRARHATLSGISAMMNDLHPHLQLNHSTIHLAKTFPTGNQAHKAGGTGVLLMPSIFSGPEVRFDPGTLGSPAITYSPRELHTAWENSTSTATTDPVSALIGKGRTAILRSTALPATTTSLAQELHLSGATVSVHLAILKSCGMVTSWRSGQRVYYQRTPLATSILTAAANPPPQH